MKTIWKYEFPITDEFKLSIPKDAKILTAFEFRTSPCLWAEVDTDMEKEIRKFAIFGTGNPMIDDGVKWISTFPMDPFVWHLYEIL